MRGELSVCLRVDFGRERFRASFNRPLPVISGQPANLLSCDKVSELMKEFPGKTETDPHLWILDHHHDLAENMGKPRQSPYEAAWDIIEEVEA